MALRNAPRVRPELILLEVMMPGIDGYEVCRRLKADAGTSAVPVIFITANNDAESLVKGFQAGGVDYVGKPFRDERGAVAGALATDPVPTDPAADQQQRCLEAANTEIREKGEGGADVVMRRILSDVQAFGGGREQEDDQTVVVAVVKEVTS